LSALAWRSVRVTGYAQLIAASAAELAYIRFGILSGCRRSGSRRAQQGGVLRNNAAPGAGGGSGLMAVVGL